MTSPFSLDGRIAVVTGALGRLGAVWIEALLDAGALVAGVDLHTAAPSPAFERLLARHGHDRIRLYRGDVTDRGSLGLCCNRCLDELGVPAVLVNNAGIDQPPSDVARTYTVEEIPVEAVRAVLDVNTVGTFVTSQIFGAEMVRVRRGSIVNIGSLYASVAPDPRLYAHLPVDPPFLKPPAYGASKAAVVNLTKYLAALWGPYGVRVNTLSPGGVHSDQDETFVAKFSERVPMRRMAEAVDLVGPLLFLASDASSYVTGIDLRVDGGFAVW